MGLFVGLALSVLAAHGVAALRATAWRGTRRLVPAIAAALLVVEAWSRPMVGPSMPGRMPPAYDAILRDLSGVPITAIANLPIAASMPTYMYYSVFHWQERASFRF